MMARRATRTAGALALVVWLILGPFVAPGALGAPCDPVPVPVPVDGGPPVPVPGPIIEPAPGQLPGIPNTGGGGCSVIICDDPGTGGLRPAAPSRSRVWGWLDAVFGVGVARAAAPCGPGPAPEPPPPPPVDPCPDRRRCAVEVASGINLPDAGLGINPGLVGLVNVPTFFWVASTWRGEDLVATRSWSGPAGGGADYIPTTVEVRYHWQATRYNFGDGGEVERRTLGTPYRPGDTSSEIQNVYGWSSLTEPGGVFHPGLAIAWSVDYTVNGDAGRLPDVVRRYDVPGYPVQQSQPIIVAPGR